MTVLNMDCIEGMRLFPDSFFDSIVTDPPYELGFMGKGWDATGIAYSVEMWREALRVLKPGGHLLAFSGSRTYHRMVVAIEDAGFEIRDQIMWVYGSGFPKSLDVSKAIDKAAGAVREVIGFDAAKAAQQTRAVDTAAYGDYAGNAGQITVPATDAARQWQGWGTALKPAHEPIVVARKPLIGTVAANVLAHGTGAINVDGCRVATDENLNGGAYAVGGGRQGLSGDEREGPAAGMFQAGKTAGAAFEQPAGRWPANLIHDGSDEVLAAFPQAPGQMADASTSDTQRAGQNVYGTMRCVELDKSAARFFYCAKASKSDRDEGLDDFIAIARPNGNKWTDQDYRVTSGERAAGRESGPRKNTHPTVKPTDLMRYLVRLVTPPGGTVLDPFAGSGSTGKAAMLEGLPFIGFELSAEYAAIATARIAGAAK